MKNKVVVFLTAMILIMGVTAYTPAAEVAQGKCVSYDKDKNSVTIDDYDLNFSPENKYGRPTGQLSVYGMANAKIGVPPAVGDILRIVYQIRGDQREVLKLMNVSKQDLMK